MVNDGRILDTKEERAILVDVLESMSLIQTETIAEDICVKNQMIMTGIACTIGMYRNDFVGNFEKVFEKQLKILDVNHQEFYIKCQTKINNKRTVQ